MPDPLTAPYWAAARERRLALPYCTDCGRHHFYPRSICPHCSSARIEWVAASGRGEVYSFTVVHRAPSPAFAAAVPYVVAIVALEEGPHLMTNIIGCAPDAVRIGMRVRVTFRATGGDVTLPVFEPM
ncbi:MAG: Zn-ribbon domain-containing OB-fold protein [Betaproteobacteria bacterium]|nr:Zn-ribbon domain-containing OB-fold protein [Betaproteobacteria bacterium]MBI2508755.1 Zn-ribbon domain-containing OB-fold protein [Betaproteobacteria bacterium]